MVLQQLTKAVHASTTRFSQRMASTDQTSSLSVDTDLWMADSVDEACSVECEETVCETASLTALSPAIERDVSESNMVTSSKDYCEDADREPEMYSVTVTSRGDDEDPIATCKEITVYSRQRKRKSGVPQKYVHPGIGHPSFLAEDLVKEGSGKKSNYVTRSVAAKLRCAVLPDFGHSTKAKFVAKEKRKKCSFGGRSRRCSPRRLRKIRRRPTEKNCKNGADLVLRARRDWMSDKHQQTNRDEGEMNKVERERRRWIRPRRNRKFCDKVKQPEKDARTQIDTADSKPSGRGKIQQTDSDHPAREKARRMKKKKKKPSPSAEQPDDKIIEQNEDATSVTSTALSPVLELKKSVDYIVVMNSPRRDCSKPILANSLHPAVISQVGSLDMTARDHGRVSGGISSAGLFGQAGTEQEKETNSSKPVRQEETKGAATLVNFNDGVDVLQLGLRTQ